MDKEIKKKAWRACVVYTLSLIGTAFLYLLAYLTKSLIVHPGNLHLNGAAATIFVFAVLVLPFLVAGHVVVYRLAVKRFLRYAADRTFFQNRGRVNALIVSIVLSGTMFLMMFFVWNAILYLGPVDRSMLLVYGATAIACVPFGYGIFRLLRHSTLAANLGTENLVLAVGCVAWLSAYILDNTMFVQYYETIHLILLAAGMFLAFLALYQASDRYLSLRLPGPAAFKPIVAIVVLLAITVPALLFAVGSAREQQAGYAALLSAYGTPRRMVMTLRRITDRDGDGFSGRFGGGDSNDTNPKIYPFSRTLNARNMRIRRRLLRTSTTPVRTAPEGAAAPNIILISVDALRCQLTRGERAPFNKACPKLHHWSRTGRTHVMRSAFPHTGKAIPSMFSGVLAPFRVYARMKAVQFLPGFLRNHGYQTAAVLTHPYLAAVRPFVSGFGKVDRKIAMLPDHASRITSARTTSTAKKVLAELKQPFFFWVHYYDPHGLYISGRRLDSNLAAYIAEVRRTDHHVSALLAYVFKRFNNQPTVIALTADHGEEFGEHRGNRHGPTVYEEVLKVPLVLWGINVPLPQVQSRVFSMLALPATLLTLAGIVPAPHMFPAIQSPRRPRYTVSFTDYNRKDDQFAVVAGEHKLIYHHRLNYFELFDLKKDPNERRNLAYTRIRTRRRLAGLLRRFLVTYP